MTLLPAAGFYLGIHLPQAFLITTWHLPPRPGLGTSADMLAAMQFPHPAVVSISSIWAKPWKRARLGSRPCLSWGQSARPCKSPPARVIV